MTAQPNQQLSAPQPPAQTATSTSDSVWQAKPWWCQPWSILLTGFGLIAASWVVLKIIWVTVLVALPLLAWMGFFLLIYPSLMQADSAAQDSSDSGSA
jgi:hypothetical protein